MKFTGTDDYVATQDLALAVDAAVALERPLLVKGEPGTGKTEPRAPGGARARPAADRVAREVDHPREPGALRVRRREAALRDSQLGDERVREVGNYIRRGKLWEAFDAEGRRGPADR